MSTVLSSATTSMLTSAPKTPWKRPNTGNNSNETSRNASSASGKAYSRSPNTSYGSNGKNWSSNDGRKPYNNSFYKNNDKNSSSTPNGTGKYTPYRSGGNYYKNKDNTPSTPAATTPSSSSSSTANVTPPIVPKKTTISIGGVASSTTTTVTKVTDVEFDTLPIDMQFKLYRADVQTKLALRKVTIDPTTGINWSILGLNDNYTVRLGKQTGRWSCTCKDYQKISRCERNCKHIYFVKLRILGNARIFTVWSDGEIPGFIPLPKVKSNLFGETNIGSTNDETYDDDHHDRDEPIVPGTKLDRSILSLHADQALCARIVRAVQRHIHEYEQHGLKGNPKYLFPMVPRPADILYAQNHGENIPPRPYYPSVGIPETVLGAFDVPVYDSDNDGKGSHGGSSGGSNGGSTKKSTSPNQDRKKRTRDEDEDDDDEDAVQDDDDL